MEPMYFIYSKETASSNIAEALRGVLDLQEAKEFHGLRHFANGEHHMLEVPGKSIAAEFLDGILGGPAIFLSRHSSSKGIAAFTVHAEGNWSEKADLGGRPRQLSMAAPVKMLDVISSINSANNTGIPVTYEATHHGPFLNHPSFFVELGGNEKAIASIRYAELIATWVANSLDSHAGYDKIAIGIGGMHYSEKFTRLALEGKYAFAHIMPKYHADCVDMIGKAFDRSEVRPDIAVIEWKSIKATQRQIIVRELDALGIDYAKV